MIDFMVLGGPRSATTWVANLLTTDNTLCMHDPLLQYTRAYLDQIVIPGKKLGISCTSSLMWPEWLNLHPAKKIILWRHPDDINLALERLGLTKLDPYKHCERINALKGVRLYHWEQVFNGATAQEICKYLGVPFCPHRHNELRSMNIQPQLNRLPLHKNAVLELSARVTELLGPDANEQTPR